MTTERFLPCLYLPSRTFRFMPAALGVFGLLVVALAVLISRDA
jgi:hypothetical protein